MRGLRSHDQRSLKPCFGVTCSRPTKPLYTRGIWRESIGPRTNSIWRPRTFWSTRRLRAVNGGSGVASFQERLNRVMYIHMFAFRFKAGVTEEQKERVAAEIRKLRSEIPQVLESWVGRNDSPRGQGYELGGVMKFADKAACDAYGAHPVHQKLLGWLMPLIEPIEVDFPESS